MNVKELKDWLSSVPDNAIVKMRTEAWQRWYDEFEVQAILHIESKFPPEKKEGE